MNKIRTLSTYPPGTKEGNSLNHRAHALIKEEIFPVSNRLLDLILSETIEVEQTNWMGVWKRFLKSSKTEPLSIFLSQSWYKPCH